MESEFLTLLQNGSKDKLVNNNNNNQFHTALMTNKRSLSKINLSSHKPVILNDKPDRNNQVDQCSQSVKDLLTPGDLVKDRWRVICKLGGGGFGEIYEAVDTKLKHGQHSSSSSSTSSYVNESQSTFKRYYTEYSLCLNCATNSALNVAVNSPSSGQNNSSAMKFKQDVGSDSGIGGIQAFSSDTQIQHGTRINSAGTTTSASLSSRRQILTCNENKNNQEEGLIHLKSSSTNNNYVHLQKINSQDFSASNASTPRDPSQTGNLDKKNICINCKCELPQETGGKFTFNSKHESNGISSDSGISSINEAYDYRVAIKAESNRQARQVLRMEVAVLRRLQGKSNICRLFGCGKNAKFNYMVMTLQGKNLSEIRRTLPGAIFTLGTAFRLIKQCITALQTLHDAGFLHRDVKPSNFAIQRGKTKDSLHRIQVTLLDFGLARPYTINGPGTEVRNARQVVGFRGTVRYASINAHAHQDLARRDDLWSLFYMFIEFICGQLPWRRIRDKELVGQMKMALNHKELAIKSGLPEDIVTPWITHLEQLEYKSMPNYEMLIACLNDWLVLHKIQESDCYDWESSKLGSLSTDMKNQKPGTINLYKVDHKPVISEQFSQKDFRTHESKNNPMNVENIDEKQYVETEKNNVKEEDEDEEEHVNKMNETLKPNTLLQVVHDNQMNRLKQPVSYLNNRHSTSQCNLMMNNHSINAESTKKMFTSKLLKQKNLLKNYGSLGADLSSHDGDIENAIIIEGEYSQNRHSKLLTIHNSADCILVDDEPEYDAKETVEMNLSANVNNAKQSLTLHKNMPNDFIATINLSDNIQEKLTVNKNIDDLIPTPNSQLPASNDNANFVDIRMENSVKKCAKMMYTKPIRNDSIGKDVVTCKSTVEIMKASDISKSNAITKELNKNIEENKPVEDGQSVYMSTLGGITSPSLPQSEDCTTNPRAKIHAIIKNLLARRLSEDNDTPRLVESTSQKPTNRTRSVAPSPVSKQGNKSSEIVTKNLDLLIDDDTDKFADRPNKRFAVDQTSPYYIHFSLGHVSSNNNEQYHRFMTVPRKDHISLSTLRLSRTGQSVTLDRSSPALETNFISGSKCSIHSSSDQILNDKIENGCHSHSINCQSEKNHPVPRRKRTLYLNNYYSEQSIQPSQNIYMKSLSIPHTNHENLVAMKKSPHQNNLLFESTAENYRQKLIDNKQKHSQQKSMSSTKLIGPTIRPILETTKSMPQNSKHTTNNMNNNSSIVNSKETESREKINSLNLLSTPLIKNQKDANSDTVQLNATYGKSDYQQTSLKSHITDSVINQSSNNQCLSKTCSEVPYEPEISKSPIQHDNKSKRLIGRDSVHNTNRSVSLPVPFNYKQSTLKGSNFRMTDKLMNRKIDDTKGKQNNPSATCGYLPLKPSSVSSTNLSEELFIKQNNVCSKSIHCRQSTDISRRRRLNSVNILPSELRHNQQQSQQFTISTSNNNIVNNSSHVSKINLRTLRSHSADRVLKPRSTCTDTIFQSYYLFQPVRSNNLISRSTSKQTLDSQNICKIHTITPKRRN
ncbi:Tau-tubulin kinase likesator [Schistosoma japonicum]|nr:Tau-tubulin kinase likesator [Schistosoma japonicum]